MKSLFAFWKKEWIEQLRSGKLWILGAIFILSGIMNPAIAKLTPWLLEIMADSLAESGMTVTEVSVSAMDSWVQFFKNMPLCLIAFLLLQASCFSKEYTSGTLVLSLTKGFPRFGVILSKASVLTLFWTVGYWSCVSITYAYNAFFWDNSVSQNLFFSITCWWVFGLWTILLMTLCATLAKSSSGVLLGTGAILLAFYLIGLLPKVGRYLSTQLTDGNSLIYGIAQPSAYATAMILTAVLSIACIAASIPILNRKQL